MKKRNKRKVDNLVPNNPEYDRRMQDLSDTKAEHDINRDTLYDGNNRFLSRVLEASRNRYGYRTTVSGVRVPFDEPLENDTEEVRMHNAAVSRQLQRRQTAKERLKRLNRVPIRKDGNKLFEEFMEEARQAVKSKYDDTGFITIYKAARSLNYPDWLLFVNRIQNYQ